MKPKHTHDCERCTFLGHFCDHDVYICQDSGGIGPSIIARFGDDGPEYASTPLRIFQRQINENSRIGGNDWSMPFRDYLFSDKVIPYHKAWMLALAVKS